MNKKRKSNIITGIVLIVSISLLSFSLFNIWKIKSQYREVEIKDEKIKEVYDIASSEESDPIKELKSKNEDVAGWISYDRAKISDVVMNNKPGYDDFYLHRDFDGNYSFAGETYIDTPCVIDADGNNSCNNTMIYGHAMKNGSKFFHINDLKGATFDENDIVTLETENKIFKYQVVGISDGWEFVTDEPFRYFMYNSYDNIGFEAFKEGLMRNTWAGDFSQLQDGDELLTLSTCYTHDLRLRLGLVSKLVETIEK